MAHFLISIHSSIILQLTYVDDNVIIIIRRLERCQTQKITDYKYIVLFKNIFLC